MAEITARQLIDRIKTKELPKCGTKSTDNAMENIRFVWVRYMEDELKEIGV